VSVLDGLVDNILSAAQPVDAWGVGVIRKVTAGAAYDKNALVTVAWRGAEVLAPYCASYTPAVGHQVLLARFGPQLIVIDRIVGTPPRT
jgi:hypothetical protein